MLMTTLNELRIYDPCEQGWKKLLTSLGKTTSDDEPLSFKSILDSNGIKDTIWCLRANAKSIRIAVEFAKWCAANVASSANVANVAKAASIAANVASAAAYAVNVLNVASAAAYAVNADYGVNADYVVNVANADYADYVTNVANVAAYVVNVANADYVANIASAAAYAANIANVAARERQTAELLRLINL